MKKLLSCLLVLVFVLGSAGVLATAGAFVTAELTNFRFLVDGSEYTMSQSQLVYAGRSYLPVRALATMLGYDVYYIEETRTIVLDKLAEPPQLSNASLTPPGAGTKVSAEITPFRFVVDGKEQVVDQSPLVYGGRSFLPVRALATLLGYETDYIEATRTIVLDRIQPVVNTIILPPPPLTLLPPLPPVSASAQLPPQFDLREWAALTPINNQGSLGSCWAVALTDSLESKIRVDSGEIFDLSINNMIVQTSRAYANGFDREHGGGAMAETGLAYLTAWNGPVLEQADPYNDNRHELKLETNTRPAKLVQGVMLFPDREHALDNELFKRHLMEHGAIYASMWKGTASTYDRFFNQETFAWYYPHEHLTPEGNGHAITLVGWDDDFPRESFNPDNLPPGKGAFIARNTKGANWGSLTPGHNMGGYFYISYYDSKLGKTMYGYPNETGAVGFTRVDDMGVYDFIYQHDTLGYNDRYHAHNNQVSLRNDFTVGLGQRERLSAVSFYTLEADVTYEIWLYRNVKGATTYGASTRIARGSIGLPGYHTIDLDQEDDLVLQERIGVEVRLSSSNEVSFAIDSANGYLSSNSEAKPGVSYVKLNGRWVDLHSVTDKGKACIKIFTRDRGVEEALILSPETMKKEHDIFIATLKSKQSEFRAGFSSDQQRVVDSVYIEIQNPLSIREFDLALKRILSLAADGHAVINITNARNLNRGGLEAGFVWLSDGLYIIDSTTQFRAGDKVLMFGGLDPKQLMATMRQTFATENDYYVRYNVNQLLKTEYYLREYGVVNSSNTVDMLIERGGERFVVKAPLNPLLVSRSSFNRNFFEYRIEKENNLGYLRFDYWPNDEGNDQAFYSELENAIHDFFADVRRNGIGNIVIDVRENGGGFIAIQYLLGEYFIKGGLPWRREHITMKDPDNFFTGTVYYLQGHGSFSLSVNAAFMFKEASDIIIVGEESGQRPNFNQGASFHDLVHMNGRYRLSSSTPPLRSFQKKGDDTINPDILIRRNIADVLAGWDTQLEGLREITRGVGYSFTADTLEIRQNESIILMNGPLLEVRQGSSVSIPVDVRSLTSDVVVRKSKYNGKNKSAP